MIIRNCMPTDSKMQEIMDRFQTQFFDRYDINMWIAGGALRSFFNADLRDKMADIDLFFPNQIEFNKMQNVLCEQGFRTVFNNDNAHKMKKDDAEIDLIKLFFQSPIETLQNFDFTVCCCGVDKDTFYYHEEFFNDLKAHRLALNSSLENVLSSFYRVDKYHKKGFHITESELDIIYKQLVIDGYDVSQLRNTANKYVKLRLTHTINQLLEDKPIRM